MPEKTLEGDHRCCKKALHPKHYAEVLATEGNSWRAAADEEEEEEQQQQEDTEDSGGESGDDKCMVCGEKEEDDVDIEDWVACEMCSQWIHSKCIPSNHPYSISHADFHCHICLQQQFSLNINTDAKGWGGSRLSVIMTLTVGNMICESPLIL